MFDDPPWDDPGDDAWDGEDTDMPPPPPEPTYKPVSKARRETPTDQDELPFDLDD
jgi:hypothetical protein